MKKALTFFVMTFLMAGLLVAAIETLVVPHYMGKELRLAVRDLADVLEQKNGARPRIISSRLRFPSNALFIGDQQQIRAKTYLPKELSSWGSIVRRSRGNRFFIRARNEAALVHGIYTFARRELGARWFLVREDELYFSPVCKEDCVQGKQAVLREPVFVQRDMSTVSRLGDGRFYRRNRLSSPYDFKAALALIFDKKLYEEHPDLFSVRKGVKKEPIGSRKMDPQPHLANPDAASYAAEQALSYFNSKPEALSFSLSINDNILFDDTDLTQTLVAPIKYFRGKPNYSDLVFTFINRVATKVFSGNGTLYSKSGQPRYLTALAYYWAEAAPSFPLHQRIMPILTADRAQWHDPEFRMEDMELIRKWKESGVERLGVWDYYYGAPLPYPRQFNKRIVQSIRYFADQGVDVFFAEMPYMLVFDGPKAYLTAQLLWDPGQCVEPILREFYHGVFGPGADDMRLFYEAFEAEREMKEGASGWIKFYLDEQAIDLFSESFIAERSSDLDRAFKSCHETPRALKYVERVRRDFGVTVKYKDLQALRRELVNSLSSEDADSVARALSDFTLSREEFYRYLSPLNLIEGYRHNLRMFRSSAQSDPTAAALGAFAIRATELQIKDLTEVFPQWSEQIALIRSIQAGEAVLTPITTNAELNHTVEPNHLGGQVFLSPENQLLIRGWRVDLRPSEKLRVSGIRGFSEQGVYVEGADIVSLFTDVRAISKGSYLLRASFKFLCKPDNRTKLDLQWYDEDGRIVRHDKLIQLPADFSDDEINVLERELDLIIPLKSPDGAVKVRLRVLTSRQAEGDFIEVSDLRLYQVQM